MSRVEESNLCFCFRIACFLSCLVLLFFQY
nr:MAG TPA: hypothetical protein [Bacteriophage sp.]